MDILRPDESLSAILDFPRDLAEPRVTATRHAAMSAPTRHDRHHAHRYCEVLFIEAGRGSHTVGDEPASAVAGDCFLLPPGLPHDPSGLASATRWVLSIGTELFDELAGLDATTPTQATGVAQLFQRATPDDGVVRIPENVRDAFLCDLARIAAERDNRQPAHGPLLRALLLQVLVTIARARSTQKDRQPIAGRGLLADVFAFIDREFRTAIGLREVAAHVSRSPAYLTTLIRKETGKTVVDWIIDRRMNEARRLLLQPDLPVQEVAAMIGYSDTGYFSKQFRRHHGTNPGGWRKRNSGAS